MEWTIQTVIEHLKPRLPPSHRALLEAVSPAMGDKKNLEKLNAFPRWFDARMLMLDWVCAVPGDGVPWTRHALLVERQ